MEGAGRQRSALARPVNAGDGFINLIKMLIPPVILCTVVLGIAGSASIKKAGRVGGKAILYFEVVSTLALVIGLVMANWFGPGRGFHVDPTKLDAHLVAGYVTQAQHMTFAEHLLKMIARTLFSAFTEGDALQVLLISVLLGFALARLGELYKLPLMGFLEKVSKLLFGVMRLILFTAAVLLAIWEGELDWGRFREGLAKGSPSVL